MDTTNAAPTIDNPSRSIIAEFLRECLPFNDLPEDDFAWVVNRLEVISFKQGHIFNEDSPNPGLRIVRSGAVELRDSKAQLLDRLGEGESFNLCGLIKEEVGCHRSAHRGLPPLFAARKRLFQQSVKSTVISIASFTASAVDACGGRRGTSPTPAV